nr:uncharacterized protein LOC113403192 [Vanessa tameamea]
MGSSIHLSTVTSYCDRQPACQAWRLWQNPPVVIAARYQPLVPGGPAIPGNGSGHGNGRAGGAKNPRQRSGYHNRRRLALATYNTRTLRTDEKIVELEQVLSKMHWDIIGLSEVRREGEDSIILKSGNIFYFREGDHLSLDGVGFIVHKSLVNNVVKIESVSTSVPYIQNYQTVLVEGHTGLRSDFDTLR